MSIRPITSRRVGTDGALDCYEAFGLAASTLSSPTLIAGRNSFHAADEHHIVADIVCKLSLDGTQRLLEIGCGVGTLLNGLAARVAEAVGVDHPSCVRKYRALYVPGNVELIEGRWPEARVAGTFDRVLVYSLMHYLPNADAAYVFIDACLRILRPGGVLMLGDIPNPDMMHRFRQSSAGRVVHERYRQQQDRDVDDAQVVARDKIFALVEPPEPYATDAFILDLLVRMRRAGMNAHVLPQPDVLPYCYSREDVVIWKPR